MIEEDSISIEADSLVRGVVKYKWKSPDGDDLWEFLGITILLLVLYHHSSEVMSSSSIVELDAKSWINKHMLRALYKRQINSLSDQYLVNYEYITYLQ